MAVGAYQEIRNSLRQLYLDDPRPWLVGFSGGKDSTLVAALVFDAVMAIPPQQRTKPVTIHGNCDWRMTNVEFGNNSMSDLKQRTKQFALDAIRFCVRLPQTPEFRILTSQLMRAATSVGANYRAACRAKSKADFVSKVGTVEEEADECGYWLELVEGMPAAVNVKYDAPTSQELNRLKQEASELTAIMVSSKKTARGRND